MKKKIISVILMVSLILPGNSVFAIEKQPIHTQKNVVRSKYSRILPYAITSSVALMCAVGGYLIGYNRGNRDHLDSLENKEITFEGTVTVSNGAIPNGHIYPIPLAKDYIKRVFRTEVPKLSKNNTFPATHFAAIEAYMRIISSHFEDEELGRKLLTMSQVMRGLIYNLDTKITVGYLIDLLNEAQNLLNQASRAKKTAM